MSFATYAKPLEDRTTEQWCAALDRKTSARLQDSATRRGLTRAEILRQAAVWYLATHDRAVAWLEKRQRGKV